MRLQPVYDQVWEFRGQMSDVWPTPGELDSLRFALCEAGEALDAHLRAIGGYARNNNRERDILAELAQSAMMLLTALGPGWTCQAEELPLIQPSIDVVCMRVAYAYIAFIQGHDNWRFHVEHALRHIARYPGMALNCEMADALQNIALKHGRTHATAD